jgi:hypothetical protein
LRVALAPHWLPLESYRVRCPSGQCTAPQNYAHEKSRSSFAPALTRRKILPNDLHEELAAQQARES